MTPRAAWAEAIAEDKWKKAVDAAERQVRRQRAIIQAYREWLRELGQDPAEIPARILGSSD